MSESTTITPAKLVLAIGLLLVVAGRGCDSIARRGMLRAQARVEHIQATFDATWEPKIDDVKQVIASTREMQPRREAERQLSQLQAQRDAAARGGYNKKLADARSEARLAGSSATMRAYWYEWVFVIGSLLLVTGLLWTAATGTWPERIICLAMLVVITFSVYILGAAWLSSAATTVQGVR